MGVAPHRRRGAVHPRQDSHTPWAMRVAGESLTKKTAVGQAELEWTSDVVLGRHAALIRSRGGLRKSDLNGRSRGDES
jgi:hypothetical protein